MDVRTCYTSFMKRLVCITGLAVVAVASAFIYLQFYKEAEAPLTTTQDNQTILPETQIITYKNESLGFSFDYPSSWIKRDDAFEFRITNNPEMLFGINFMDPMREKERLVEDCLANRCVDWANKEPSQTTCEPIFSELSEEQNNRCGSYLTPRNIYIRVYRSDLPVKDWLLKTYKIEHSELERYEVGSEITLDGQKGYRSSTGCCASTDYAYVVEKNGYIYEFGTNSDLREILQQFSSNFRFMAEGTTAKENVSE